MIHTDRSVGSEAENGGPETWYGEPQHERPDDGLIEFERYGEPNHETPLPAFRIVPGIEYPAGAWVNWSTTDRTPEPVVIG